MWAAAPRRRGTVPWPAAVAQCRGPHGLSGDGCAVGRGHPHHPPPAVQTPTRGDYFPWPRAINWSFVPVDSLIFRHDRVRLFRCKHLCFIRFTLFLFFYFELYTFGK